MKCMPPNKEVGVSHEMYANANSTHSAQFWRFMKYFYEHLGCHLGCFIFYIQYKNINFKYTYMRANGKEEKNIQDRGKLR